MRHLLFFAAVALIAWLVCGCAGPRATPEPRDIPVAVYKPVAVSCVPANVGPVPAYSDNDFALRGAEDGAAREILLILGRSERQARSAVVEPVIDGCRTAAQ